MLKKSDQTISDTSSDNQPARKRNRVFTPDRRQQVREASRLLRQKRRQEIQQLRDRVEELEKENADLHAQLVQVPVQTSSLAVGQTVFRSGVAALEPPVTQLREKSQERPARHPIGSGIQQQGAALLSQYTGKGVLHMESPERPATRAAKGRFAAVLPCNRSRGFHVVTSEDRASSTVQARKLRGVSCALDFPGIRGAAPPSDQLPESQAPRLIAVPIQQPAQTFIKAPNPLLPTALAAVDDSVLLRRQNYLRPPLKDSHLLREPVHSAANPNGRLPGEYTGIQGAPFVSQSSHHYMLGGSTGRPWSAAASRDYPDLGHRTAAWQKQQQQHQQDIGRGGASHMQADGQAGSLPVPPTMAASGSWPSSEPPTMAASGSWPSSGRALRTSTEQPKRQQQQQHGSGAWQFRLSLFGPKQTSVSCGIAPCSAPPPPPPDSSSSSTTATVPEARSGAEAVASIKLSQHTADEHKHVSVVTSASQSRSPSSRESSSSIQWHAASEREDRRGSHSSQTAPGTDNQEDQTARSYGPASTLGPDVALLRHRARSTQQYARAPIGPSHGGDTATAPGLPSGCRGSSSSSSSSSTSASSISHSTGRLQGWGWQSRHRHVAPSNTQQRPMLQQIEALEVRFGLAPARGQPHQGAVLQAGDSMRTDITSSLAQLTAAVSQIELQQLQQPQQWLTRSAGQLRAGHRHAEDICAQLEGKGEPTGTDELRPHHHPEAHVVQQPRFSLSGWKRKRSNFEVGGGANNG